MGKFLTGDELEEIITDIVFEAQEILLIVSPYIKLDSYFKRLFSQHENNPDLHIIVFFGKNDTSFQKSLSLDDFEFFKKFPNVSIIYVKNLHAKYYGNEKKGVTTSINLYDYSFKNNIEFGIFRETKISDRFGSNFDADVFNFCFSLAEEHPAIYINRPIFQKSLLGLKSKFQGTKILLDQSKEFIKNKFNNNPRLQDYSEILDFEEIASHKPSREEHEYEVKNNNYKQNKVSITKNQNFNPKNQSKHYQEPQPHFGYCIRTGVEINFNPERPLSYQAFLVWNQYGDTSYQENYCHYSGEPSFGETCVSKPILRKNWKKAKQFL